MGLIAEVHLLFLSSTASRLQAELRGLSLKDSLLAGSAHLAEEPAHSRDCHSSTPLLAPGATRGPARGAAGRERSDRAFAGARASGEPGEELLDLSGLTRGADYRFLRGRAEQQLLKNTLACQTLVFENRHDTPPAAGSDPEIPIFDPRWKFQSPDNLA